MGSRQGWFESDENYRRRIEEKSKKREGSELIPSDNPFERLGSLESFRDEVARARGIHKKNVDYIKSKMIEFDNHLNMILINGAYSRRRLVARDEEANDYWFFQTRMNIGIFHDKGVGYKVVKAWNFPLTYTCETSVTKALPYKVFHNQGFGVDGWNEVKFKEEWNELTLRAAKASRDFIFQLKEGRLDYEETDSDFAWQSWNEKTKPSDF